jgi:hypothetical protein
MRADYLLEPINQSQNISSPVYWQSTLPSTTQNGTQQSTPQGSRLRQGSPAVPLAVRYGTRCLSIAGRSTTELSCTMTSRHGGGKSELCWVHKPMRYLSGGGDLRAPLRLLLLRVVKTATLPEVGQLQLELD